MAGAWKNGHGFFIRRVVISHLRVNIAPEIHASGGAGTMMKIRLFGALIASAALAACGGGEDAGGDASETTSAMADGAQETSAEETSGGEGMAGDDGAAEESAPAEDTMGDMAEDAQGAAEDMANDAAAAAEGAAEDMMDGATQAAEDAAGAMEDAAGAAQDAAADASSDGPLVIAGLTGDPEAGRRVFARCRSCHVLEEGVNRVGPSLYGIFGRETGSVEGFRYSDANANAGITWTGETMFEYLENPREYIPGTIMSFPGLRDPQDRVDVIAYMKENGGLGDEG
jgi:cytochrome c